MKRYQLIGRKKKDTRIRTPKYPRLHLLSLPLEILIKILNFLTDSNHSLLSLSLTCRKFHSIVVKNYLYKDIIFTDSKKFISFSHTHFPNKRYGITDSSTNVNLIQAAEFINPPIRNSENCKTKIAGSYAVESETEGDNRRSHEAFEHSLALLLKHDYNLKQITISEISPQFLFNDMIVESLFKKYKKRAFRSLNKLVLKAQTGWSILFVLNHITKILDFYDTINELELHNFIIDESKLLGVQVPKEVLIETLTMVGCKFQNRGLKSKPCELFKYTKELRLLDITNNGDLSMIDLIKCNNAMTSLTIDLGSKIFYSKSKFNYKVFNPFFKLVCSKNGFYANLENLTLVNIDLFTRHDDHTHDSFRDGELETIDNLLEHVSNISALTMVVKHTPTIRMCRKCGTIESDNLTVENIPRSDWESLLKPLIKRNTKTRIYDSNYKLIFEVA